MDRTSPGASARSVQEQRADPRIQVAFSGKLFIPAEALTLDCRVCDISASGAGVLCADAPPLQTFVVLYIDGMGRYEAVAVRYVDGVLGLQFQCREARRQRLVQSLNLFMNKGVTRVTQLRAHERVPSVTALHFTRPSGERVRCDVQDISLHGISLKTNGRPPINEVIQVGRSFGRVVRHHEHGIGVRFITADHVSVFESAPGQKRDDAGAY